MHRPLATRPKPYFRIIITALLVVGSCLIPPTLDVAFGRQTKLRGGGRTSHRNERLKWRKRSREEWRSESINPEAGIWRMNPDKSKPAWYFLDGFSLPVENGFLSAHQYTVPSDAVVSDAEPGTARWTLDAITQSPTFELWSAERKVYLHHMTGHTGLTGKALSYWEVEYRGTGLDAEEMAWADLTSFPIRISFIGDDVLMSFESELQVREVWGGRRVTADVPWDEDAVTGDAAVSDALLAAEIVVTENVEDFQFPWGMLAPTVNSPEVLSYTLNDRKLRKFDTRKVVASFYGAPKPEQMGDETWAMGWNITLIDPLFNKRERVFPLIFGGEGELMAVPALADAPPSVQELAQSE